MKHNIFVIILLAIACSVAVATTLKPVETKSPDEEFTFSIRRSTPQEAASGNLYHKYIAFMKNLETSKQDLKNERSAEEIDWNKIVNIGKQIWDIVVKNQPTYEIKNATANVVPVREIF